MDRDRFVGTGGEPWWLLSRDADPRIDERRKALGEAFGWTYPDWYTEENKLAELYRVLESQHSVLFVDLDNQTDVDRYVLWLDHLLIALNPAPAAASPASSAPAPDAAAPKKTGLFGKGKAEAPAAEPVGEQAGEQEEAGPDAEARPEPAPAPQKKPSLFGSKPKADAPVGEPAPAAANAPGPSAAAAPAAANAPGPSAAAAPAAASAPANGPAASEAATKAASAAAAPAASEAEASEPANGPAPEAPVAQDDMANAIKDAISELSQRTGETASQIAEELGLTEEELAHVAEHPDLERLVAEEMAQLLSQQS